MELLRTELHPSPVRPDHIRLTGQIRYADGFTEELWFEYPNELRGKLSATGNPWLAALLPLAAYRQESLRLGLPVDAQLLAQVPAIMQTWAQWFPNCRPIAVAADAQPALTRSARVATCFSGGVDSFFSLLSHEPGGPAAADGPPVDDLVYVWGFDLKLSHEAQWRRLRDRLASAAAAFRKTLLTPITNIRDTRYRQLDWGRFGHGPAIAAVFLALESRVGLAYVPATFSESYGFSWGSHPDLSPRFSTAAVQFRYDGSSHTRVQKLECVAKHPEALAALHVCWQSRSDQNCGTCEKCIRTMVILELLGKLRQTTSFPANSLNLATLHRLYVPSHLHDRAIQEVQDHARAAGRLDLVRSIQRARQRSAWIRRLGMLGQPYPPKGRIARAVARRVTKLLLKVTQSRGTFAATLAHLICVFTDLDDMLFAALGLGA